MPLVVTVKTYVPMVTVHTASAASGVTAPADTEYTVPFGVNSSVSGLPATVAPGGRRITSESSDGVERNVSSGPGNGYAFGSHRFPALSVDVTPVSSRIRIWPACGHENRT